MSQARRQIATAEDTHAAIESERATLAGEQARLEAELAAVDGPFQAAQQEYQRQLHAFEQYQKNIGASAAFADACPTDDPIEGAEPGNALAVYLGEFVPETNRDAALKQLDTCRKSLLQSARKRMKTTVKDLQAEYAINIEDAYDENNPYSRGTLTAKVNGTKLDVRMRGNFEGRARHSQDQVDAWCAGASGLFTGITLTNSHGTFKCKPESSPTELMDKILDEAGLSNSWIVGGDSATPARPEPPPPPPPEIMNQRAELVAQLEALGTRPSELDQRDKEAAVAHGEAHQVIERADRNQRERVAKWGETEIARAKRVQVAGAVVVGIGGAVGIISLAATQAGIDVPPKFLPIGLGISIPLLVTGVVFIVSGGVRKNRVREQL
jgi:hypothetical protein